MEQSTTPPTRVQRWEQHSEIPLMLLAIAFLVAYAWPILNPTIPETLRSFFDTVSWTVWAAFAVDLLVRFILAEDRLPYARAHWYDVALVVVPLLRPLRLLRLLAFIRILDRSLTSTLVGRITIYVIGAAAAALGLGSLAMLDAERDAPGANITTWGDALWWAATTVTTVGYGDRYPVTFGGAHRRGAPHGGRDRRRRHGHRLRRVVVRLPRRRRGTGEGAGSRVRRLRSGPRGPSETVSGLWDGSFVRRRELPCGSPRSTASSPWWRDSTDDPVRRRELAQIRRTSWRRCLRLDPKETIQAALWEIRPSDVADHWAYRGFGW